MTYTDLKKSPLYNAHEKLDASFGQRGGWNVAMSYSGPAAEAELTRKRAGVIDLSHQARVRISGGQMLDLAEKVFTHDVAHQEDDSICDSLMLDEKGGILADCKLIRMEDDWLVIAQACNREKIIDHLNSAADSMNVKILDQTEKTAQICILGNQGLDILKSALPEDPSSISEGRVMVKSLLLARYIAARKNLGGLWALDVILPKMFAAKAWRFITQKAGENCVDPLGVLGYEILVMEEGLPRWGCELNQTINPYCAGLENLMDMNHGFIGKPALQRLGQSTPQRRRAGLVIESQSPANLAPMGTGVFTLDGTEVGTITSCAFSPSLQKIIAQCYLTIDAIIDANPVKVAIPNQSEPVVAKITELPFVTYDQH